MVDRTEVEQVLESLAAAPGKFARLLAGLEDADSVDNSDEEGWTPVQVIAHLRSTNAILEPRILFVLVRDNPPLVGYDDARWLQVARYGALPVIDSLESMRMHRNELVQALRGITLEEWERTGTHEVRGPMTVLEIARQIVEHDNEHLAQIERSIGVLRGR